MNRKRDDEPTLDPHAEAMAEFCRKAGITLQQVIGPLEILNHLLYLAVAEENAGKMREYLTGAHEQARIVTRAHAELLNSYPGPRLQTS